MSCLPIVGHADLLPTTVNRVPRISERSIDATRPVGTDAVRRDGELAGFGLRVRQPGRKVYGVQNCVAGQLRWFTIGAHGPISPDPAWGKASEILALAKIGTDPPLPDKPGLGAG